MPLKPEKSTLSDFDRDEILKMTTSSDFKNSSDSMLKITKMRTFKIALPENVMEFIHYDIDSTKSLRRLLVEILEKYCIL